MRTAGCFHHLRGALSMRHPSRKAFGLAEILLSTALMGALLASVAVAMHASSRSYTENTKITEVTQTARFIMSKMETEIRRCEDVGISGSTLTILPLIDASNLTKIEYEYTGGVLNYKRTVNGTVTSYPLLSSTDDVKLTSFTTNLVSGKDAAGNNCTISATMKMTFVCDGNSFTVTASAAPRRNQVY